MSNVSKVIWIVVGVIFNALTVYGLTDYLIDKSMSGFNTSQSNLSIQMAALQGSLENVRSKTDGQVSETRGDLTRELSNLTSIVRDMNTGVGQRLQETNSQLASLNATLVGIDRRLSDTIARQERVEGILLKQRVLFGPPSASTVDGTKFADLWLEAGFDIEPLLKFDEASALSDWTRDAGLLKE